MVSPGPALVAILLVELFGLFLVSRHMINALASLIYRVSRSEKLMVSALAVLFLPGTMIHELSHALVAVVLRVPVGRMEFLPKMDSGTIRLGSVEIGQSDRVRRSLIGVAPFLVGMPIMLVVFVGGCFRWLPRYI